MSGGPRVAPAAIALGLLVSVDGGDHRAAAAAAAPAPSPAASRPFRVNLQGVEPPVADAMSGIPGVALAGADESYDLRITQDELGFKLLHPAGDEIAAYEPAQLAEVLKRVSRQAAVQGLIDLTFPRQDFAVTLEIPGGRGSLKEGEAFTIEFTAERDSHVLLFDVDRDGYLSVLYPFDAEEARAVRKGRVPATGELHASPPFGTEYLKLVAFEEKPTGFEKWLGRNDQHFAPTGPEMGQILRMITGAKGGKAQAGLRVVTRGPRG